MQNHPLHRDELGGGVCLGHAFRLSVTWKFATARTQKGVVLQSRPSRALRHTDSDLSLPAGKFNRGRPGNQPEELGHGMSVIGPVPFRLRARISGVDLLPYRRSDASSIPVPEN